MKNIIHVVNISFVIPYYLGDQINYFKEKGVKINIACSPNDFFFSYAKKKSFIPHAVIVKRSFDILQDIKSVLKLISIIRREKISIVIGHTPKGGLLAMMAAFLTGTKTRIYFRHGLMYQTSKGLKRRVLISIERLTGFLATKVVCVSPSVLQISNDDNLSEKNKNIILGKGTCNGLDIQKFNPLSKTDENLKKLYSINDNYKIIGFVGRLVKDKGIIELIEAWKILIESSYKIKLLLVGPMEDRDALPKHIADFIIKEPSIIYTGLTENTVQYYKLMDIFILPSYREGFPTVVLEASSMELPVITSRFTGCIDSIIENVTGIFTDVDPLSIKLSIEKYLKNEILAKNHGLNGRRFVRDNFDQIKIWEEIERKVLN